MMKEEFEKLAGYTVSYEDYTKIIEPMYLATDLNKADFVQCINKKRFAQPDPKKVRKQLIHEMKEIAQHLQYICGHYSDFESEQKLERLVHDYAYKIHHLDWNNDLKVWAYTIREYEFPDLGRGCTYPVKVRIGRDQYLYEEFWLV